jgi:hypothetical protein
MTPRFVRDLAGYATPWRRGTAIARRRGWSVALLAVTTSLTSMGCILRDFDYEEPVNVPPSVHSTSETPMTRVRVIDLDTPIGTDGGVATNLEFVATVRDVDVRQPLEALVYLDRNPDAPSRNALVGELSIPPVADQSPLNRRVRFSIPLAELSRGCHIVELHVSSEFVGAINPQPADPADLGVGVWFVAATDAASPAVDMTACPRYQ